MKKSLCAIMAALLLLSCQEEELCTSPTPIEKPIAEHTFTIPVDSALANLAAFMADEETSTTRSAAVRVVSSVTPIKYSPKMTRSTGANVDCENLLYVANFENEQGYAILAGDTRIGEDVLAVVDEGSLSEAVVCAAMDMIEEERFIYEGYPTTGPGFFTLPETGDELYMNPNTIDLYDSTYGDTYVGNFRPYYENETNDSVIDFLPNPDATPLLLTTSLCVSYALDAIDGYDGPVDLMPMPGTGGGGGNLPNITTETFVSEWSVVESVYPILTKYYSWHQGKPFNNLCPERRLYILFGEKQIAPTGCFPLAIAKLMTHFECPNTFVNDGYTVDWSELKRDCFFCLPYDTIAAAHLLRGVGKECLSLYFYEGTFTLPLLATAYMRSIGFDNTRSNIYSFSKVKEMLDINCPPIVFSVPNKKIKLSHSWNIDGYKIKERIVTTKTYRDGVLYNTITNKETNNMVHCDFGWGTMSNGYYISGLFKLKDPSVEPDPGTSHIESTYYDGYLRVVTYDKP